MLSLFALYRRLFALYAGLFAERPKSCLKRPHSAKLYQKERNRSDFSLPSIPRLKLLRFHRR